MFNTLSDRLSNTFRALQGKNKLSDKNIQDAIRDVRKALLEADVAFEVVKAFIAALKTKAVGLEVEQCLSPTQSFIKLVEAELVAILSHGDETLNLRTQAPAVIMVAGLQGAGKTTSVAKLANQLNKYEKKKVLLVSADVYRPAAIEQLKVLSEQIEVDFFPSDISQKPIDIVNNAKKIAAAEFYDVLIVDTAGRLHIDDEMMAEIKDLQDQVSPIETLFVIDSMTGQDAVNTAKVFGDTLNLTGIVLTKTDGDARGGVALSVKQITNKPIKFLGVGEKIADFEPFHPDRVVSKMLGMGDILSLIEDIERKVDYKKSQATVKKIKKGKFDLGDMRDQLQQMQEMGGINNLLDKLPMGVQIPDQVKGQIMNEKQTIYMVAIVNSMTPKEREYVKLIKGSRKQRIAKGSGTSIQQVNQVLKQFEKMQKMMKKMKGSKMQAMMKKMQGNNILPDNLGGKLKGLNSPK